MTEINHLFELARELVLFTDQSVFLTGKAGTGKTTFLRDIREATTKNTAVVAPTGVAAINAGGVTMHSFFQLPFEPFIPDGNRYLSGGISYQNLFSKVKLSSIKRDVMEALELLVIDEVSMLRSDQLDCIDAILRGVRKDARPFGGVQVLLIGDLFQLPPVVTDNDRAILDGLYESPFFFDAKVLQRFPLRHIELTKVYRQKEQQFIDLLNNVRNNTLTESDFQMLDNRYVYGYRPDEQDGFITITSHNYKADKINEQELAMLDGEVITYNGETDGEFNTRNLPAEMELHLKTGARVMFVKNDSGEDRRYYNGRLATVERAGPDEIVVRMQDDGSTLVLEKEVWKNIRYNLDKKTNTLQEEELGSYTQYPVRLAWAITIHKSQGLTFDKVVIDAGRSFAAGQVYVALSRCTSMEGMVLLSKITPDSIRSDERITGFSANPMEEEALRQLIAEEKPRWQATRLVKAFDLDRLLKELKTFPDYILTKQLPDTTAAWEMASDILTACLETQGILERFRQQLKDMLSKGTGVSELKDRTQKAAVWLAERLHKKQICPLEDHVASLSGVSRVRKHLTVCNNLIDSHKKVLRDLCALELEGTRLVDAVALEAFLPADTRKPVKVKKKLEKGATYATTLRMLREGKSPEEIATERGLTYGTIESHFARLIAEGELLVTEVIPDEKLSLIQSAIRANPGAALNDLKRMLSDSITFGEIRCVKSHMALSDK